jgi:hypothetical protein
MLYAVQEPEAVSPNAMVTYPSSGYEDAVRHMVDSQDWLPAQYGYDFKKLFGRPLHLIDCQNIFCELAKYTRFLIPT